MLKKMSVKAGLIALLVVMILIQLLVSVIGGQAISNGAASLQKINRMQNQELGSLSDSYIFSLRARTASAVAVHELEIGMLDDSTKTCDRIQNYLQKSSQELAIFLAIDDGNDEGRALTKAVAETYQAYRKEALEPAVAAIKAQSTDIYYDILEKKMDRYSNAYDKALEQFRQYAEKRAQLSTDAADSASRLQLTIIIISFVASLIITILSWFALRKIIISPLDESISQLEFIAEGDLTHQIDDSGNNEMGRLAKALNKMQNALSLSMVQVREAGNQIDVGARELSAGNANLAQRTDESAASLEETAASMEQLTSTVKMNAMNSEQASQLAKNVSTIADKGSEVVNQVMNKMQAITESSSRIGDIISVIDGIAFQTNILALNAAVEAARAGEQGRGFAVVAGEVRNLAQRSAQSAKEIKELIVDSDNRIVEGEAMVKSAAETMGEIAREVRRVTSLMSEITIATTEQTHGIEQVNVAITQMDQVAQQNAALVEQGAAAMRSLEEQAQRLAQTVAVFKLDHQGFSQPQELLRLN
ncbi:methyl-accepting chemotaxis protein [Rouxiella sp. Mn2063]|uniref:methyl-accepting chemotaxis protein n=1 Tax=Rouxiella sp. Mn2063 TaxID=3395262 RepID=UPI003BC9EE79